MWILKSIAFTLLLMVLFDSCFAKFGENVAVVTEEERTIYRKYIEFDKQLRQLMSAGTKMALPYLMKATESLNLTTSCTSNIMILMNGVRRLKISAMRFVDATGKLSDGYLNGNMHLLGDYEECLNSSMLHRSGEVAFRGQYCLVHYRPLLPKQKRPVTLDGGLEELVEATRNTSEVVKFLVSKAQLFYYHPSKFGMCVPSGCSKSDMDQIIKYFGDAIYFDATVAYCDMDDEVFLDPGKITYVCLFVLIGTLAVFGTAVEYLSWKRDIHLKSPIVKTVMCFSILSNFPRAISTKMSPDSIACLHGIRALTLFYIILLHQYYAVVKYFISSNVTRTLDEIPQFFMQIVTNGFMTADVFFFVGGLVNCYSRMKMKTTERRKTNFLLQINHRIWRIGPTYLIFCFMMSLYRPYGPMRVYEKKEYVEKCEKYWWQNALFINNFFLQDDTCSPHSWYIAADMQLFLLSLFTIPLLFNKHPQALERIERLICKACVSVPAETSGQVASNYALLLRDVTAIHGVHFKWISMLFDVTLQRHPKRGLIANAVMIFVGIFSSVIGTWVSNLTPGVVFYRPNRDEINKAWNAHTSTFPHIAPYFAGILMGYYLAVKKDVKISTLSQVIGWPVATVLFTSMLFITQIWNSGGIFTVVESTFYFGFSKILFVLAIGWMVLCCTSGNGGIINYILCLPLWIPISRISFAVYLIAPFLQTFYFANSRTMVDGHTMPLIWRYAGDIGISILLGLVIAVLVEAPFKAVEKLIFDRWSVKKENDTDKPTEVVIKTITGDKLEKNGSISVSSE